MKIYFYTFFLFLSFCLFADEKELLERLNSHILIEDYSSALEEAKSGISKSSSPSNKLKLKYIECLALNDREIEAINELKKIEGINYESQNHDVMENICWAILNKASKSQQYTTRLMASIGVHFTHDVRAINILSKLMKDTNAIIRSVAIQLSSSYMDKPLKDIVESLFVNERLWFVRLEVIRAIGKMKIFEKQNQLKEIIASDKTTFEEKEIASTALVNISDNINYDEIKSLALSSKAGLRKLACDLASYFNVIEAKDLIVSLVKDPITDVRISALNAICLNYLNEIDEKILKEIILGASKDLNPYVAITASYIGLLKNYSFSENFFKKYIYNEDDIEGARFASCALSKVFNKALKLKKQILKNHPDIYVKANLALGLIAERKLLKEASDILFNFLKTQREKLMWEESKNPLFQVLCPSYLRHIDQIPRYPEGIDQMTRLHILSILAIIDDKKACEGIKDFLKEKGWGITGFASATLLKEGDEEALDIVKELLNEKDQNVKIQAALVLALLGKDETVLGTLQEAYNQVDYNMKIQILEAIGHIANKKSIKFLINILDEPYQNLRVVASSSLIRCINS
jgi:HEAT repeat protein